MEKTNELLAKLQAENLRDEALQQQMYQICQVIAKRAIFHAEQMNEMTKINQSELNAKHSSALLEDIALLRTLHGAANYRLEYTQEYIVCHWIEWDGNRIYTYEK